MNVSILMDKVLPQSSLLFKDSGLWIFHKDEEDFIYGHFKAPYATQEADERFEDFIERIVESLMKDEKEENNP